MKSGRALLRKFKKYPQNARIHPKAELDLLAEILRLRGADQPIVVDEGWMILKGHGRLEAAKMAGLKEFPFVQRLGLTESEKRAIRIEDNALPLLAGWDKTLLAADLISLKSDGYDMKLLGFGDAQLVTFMTTPTAPGEFQTLDEGTVTTEYRCPKCSWEWSGKPK
jgi:ParB-like chromosome segregation protein Spo0J